MGQGTNGDTGTCDTCPLGHCRWCSFLLLAVPVAGKRATDHYVCGRTRAWQHSLGNTSELTKTGAADEEVHLGVTRHASENRVGTDAGTNTHRRKRIVNGFDDERVAHPDDACRCECCNRACPAW